MKVLWFLGLTVMAAAFSYGIASAQSSAGNLGYNSYEGYMTGGYPYSDWTYGGTGYPTPGDNPGDFYHRYIPPEQWGQYGYGTGHAGEGYGPYIFKDPDKQPRGMFDELPAPLSQSPPPSIKVKNGCVRVALPSTVPGICRVTVTLVAFNNADLVTQTATAPPYVFNLPVMDGLKNVRVRIDYVNNGLSATSYPL